MAKLNYIATIMHSSISRAREIQITGDLQEAKNAADLEFGDEQADYEIVIQLDSDYRPIIASRLISNPRWTNAS